MRRRSWPLAAMSLLEITVVVFVIATVLGIGSISVPKLFLKSKSAERLDAVTNIQTALNLYKQDNGFYPTSLSFGQPLIGSSNKTYLTKLPVSFQDANCNNPFTYAAADNGRGYHLRYCLSVALDKLPAGDCVATPGHLCGQSCSSGLCGGSCGACATGQVCEDSGFCSVGICRLGHDEDCGVYRQCLNNTCVNEDYVIADPVFSGIHAITKDSHNVLHVVYQVSGDYKLYYSKSSNNGLSWSDPLLVSDDPSNSSVSKSPEIVVDHDDNLHIFWYRYINSTTNSLRYKKLTAAGVLDANSQAFTDNLVSISKFLGNFNAAVNSAGEVFAVATYYRSSDSRYYVTVFKYNPTGNSWEIYFRSAYNNLTIHSGAQLAIDGNDNFIVAKMIFNGSYYRSSISGLTKDLGNYFSEDYVSTEAYDQAYPHLLVDDNNDIHVTWLGKYAAFPSYAQVRYRKFSVVSKTWGSISNLTGSNITRDNAAASMDSAGNIYVFWSGADAVSDCSLNRRAVYKKLSGGSWSGPFNVLAGSPYQCTINNNVIDVLWAKHPDNVNSAQGADVIYSHSNTLIYHHLD